jgi:hypothetical protein
MITIVPGDQLIVIDNIGVVSLDNAVAAAVATDIRAMHFDEVTGKGHIEYAYGPDDEIPVNKSITSEDFDWDPIRLLHNELIEAEAKAKKEANDVMEKHKNDIEAEEAKRVVEEQKAIESEIAAEQVIFDAKVKERDERIAEELIALEEHESNRPIDS